MLRRSETWSAHHSRMRRINSEGEVRLSAYAFFGVAFLVVAFFVVTAFLGAAFFLGATLDATDSGALVLVTRPDFVFPSTRVTSFSTAGAEPAAAAVADLRGLLAFALGLAAAVVFFVAVFLVVVVVVVVFLVAGSFLVLVVVAFAF